MKPLREALISKDKIKWASTFVPNKYGITKKDMIDGLKGFPVSVVIRMIEEQEMQGYKPDVTVFQKNNTADAKDGGFAWDKTVAGSIFWLDVIDRQNFNKFYKEYPEYKKYDE